MFGCCGCELSTYGDKVKREREREREIAAVEIYLELWKEERRKYWNMKKRALRKRVLVALAYGSVVVGGCVVVVAVFFARKS